MDDDLWTLSEPLLPSWPEKAPGPKPVDDRLCLQGILYVLYSDICWELLLLELGFGSGQTCWRRLGRWHKARVFERLHHILLTRLHAANALNWTRACVDASHIHAERGGEATGPTTVNGGETGSKHHLICDGNGTRFKVFTTAANVNDVTQTLAFVDGIPPVAGKPGRPRRRPDAVLGDKGYDSNPNWRELRRRLILPVISHKGAPNI
ncbi:IS5 family transposase [Streptomyces albogriseolus]|uniref:IS5 family transposase n=1 Tax=Streptomyces albogriseolus TaxID=1887 RepID=UPI003F4E33E8